MTLSDDLARCWDALNGGDPNAFLDLYDSEIELYIPAWVSPDSGLFQGADAVNRWYANNFAQWSDQRWELTETFEKGRTWCSSCTGPDGESAAASSSAAIPTESCRSRKGGS